MTKLWFICLYTKPFAKITISHKFIDIFVFFKKELTVNTLNLQKPFIVFFFQKFLYTPTPIPLSNIFNTYA